VQERWTALDISFARSQGGEGQPLTLVLSGPKDALELAKEWIRFLDDMVKSRMLTSACCL
jgi:hypothetical protein